MKTLGKIFVGGLATVGFLTLLTIVAGIVAIFTFAPSSKEPEAPEEMILTLNLDGGYPEGRRPDLLAEIRGGGDVTLLDALIAIDRAKDDPRVTGIYATVSGGGFGFAQAQDLRNAIKEFRESGKPAVVFSETMGEGGSGTGAYYVASAFDDIWLQPSGQIELFGIAAQQLFLADFLQEWGVEAEALTRKEYKSAMEMFTNASMSDANREAITALLDSIFDQIVDGVAEQREMTTDGVRDLINTAPILAQQALISGLVDRLGYRDEVVSDIEARMGTETRVGINEYLSYPLAEDQPTPEKTIAMITGVGPITRGDDEMSPFGGEEGIKSGVMAQAIRDAVADENVDAILLRVDSPGGSYVASDTIWREVMLAKAAEKPVIVSMGNVAASGGYFIAMAGDHILAQPGTITGSIGVVFGKFNFDGALEKLDINVETIATNDSATIYSPFDSWTDAQRARLNDALDVIYEDFTTKAAQGRGMDVDDLEQVARGRVWTGEDALDIGLIDQLGGLSEAISFTKEAIGLTSDDIVWLKSFPKEKDPLEAFLESLFDGSLPFGLMTFLSWWSALSAEFNPWLTQMQAMDGPSLITPISVQ